MLNPELITAVETQLAWLKWVKDPRHYWDAPELRAVFPAYELALETSDTFYMAPAFADLVEHARIACPETMKFDARWLQAPQGFLYLSQPLHPPRIVSYPDDDTQVIQAVSWRTVAPGLRLPDNARSHGTEVMRTTQVGDVQFLFYSVLPAGLAPPGEPGLYPFYPWSHVILGDGAALGARVADFEAINKLATDGSNYVSNPDDAVLHPGHELRWLYAAFHLMAQRLATTVTHPTDRATKRRAAKGGQVAPPIIKVITLRRLEQDRANDPQGGTVDWHWRWAVRGHWREQYYPSDGTHKPVFIEAYVKGPDDRPLKPVGQKLFVATR